MLDEKCRKCDGENLQVLQVGKYTGLYCRDCGAWVRWLKTRKEVRDAYNRYITPDEVRGRAIKKVERFGRTTLIRCEKCNCLLYSSNVNKPAGQFDLINASFCPQCGVEFVDVHKKISK